GILGHGREYTNQRYAKWHNARWDSAAAEVRAEGIEPPRSFEHQDLNLACLPSSSTPARFQGIVTPMAETVVVHPNRDKAESKATKAAVILLMLASAALILIV